jgi:hypothetical protein
LNFNKKQWLLSGRRNFLSVDIFKWRGRIKKYITLFADFHREHSHTISITLDKCMLCKSDTNIAVTDNNCWSSLFCVCRCTKKHTHTHFTRHTLLSNQGKYFEKIPLSNGSNLSNKLNPFWTCYTLKLLVSFKTFGTIKGVINAFFFKFKRNTHIAFSNQQ